MVELHRQRNCIQHNGEKHRVFAQRRRGESPEFVLERILGNVELYRFSVERKFDTVALIFVQRTVLEVRLALRLEGDNDKTDEDVDHEEGEDDDVDKVEHKDDGSVVLFWTDVRGIRVDGDVQDPAMGNIWKT